MDVTAWLLDSDPAIRWQVLRDLTDAPAGEVSAERARVAREGWGARLLGLRDENGIWEGGACFPASFRGDLSAGQPWTSTLPTLTLLWDFGIAPDDPVVQEMVATVRERCRWEHEDERFFDGEVEPCINGRTLGVGAYFGVDVSAIADRLIGDQLDDGGWNCETENGSVRSSFHSTICVLEGLSAFECAGGGSAGLSAAREAGERYLLDRRLMRRLSTGEVPDPDWLSFSFPTWWHYDVLRGLDYFRSTGRPADPALAEGLGLVRDKRRPDGTWPAENSHVGPMHFAVDGGDGQPSRWTTLRALRVLRWAGDGMPA